MPARPQLRPVHVATIAAAALVLAGGGYAIGALTNSGSSSPHNSTSPRGSTTTTIKSGGTPAAYPSIARPMWGSTDEGLGSSGLAMELGLGAPQLFGSLGSIGGISGLNDLMYGTLVRGTVTKIESGSITITTPDGSNQSIDTTSSTTYFTMTDAASAGDLAVGSDVLISIGAGVSPGGPGTSGSSGSSGASGVSGSSGVTGLSGSSGVTGLSGSSGSSGVTGLSGTTGKPTPQPTPATTVPVTVTPPVSVNPAAATIVIVKPFSFGTVTSVTSDRIVVTEPTGLQRDIDVNGSTTYTEAGQSIDEGTLSKGAEIFSWGDAASDPTRLQASHVLLVGPVATGSVTAISGSTITISTWSSGLPVSSGTGTTTNTGTATSGGPATVRGTVNGSGTATSGVVTTSPSGTASGNLAIRTTGSTIFLKGTSSASLSDLAVGDPLTAIGTHAGDGSFAATAILFEQAPKVEPLTGSAAQSGSK